VVVNLDDLRMKVRECAEQGCPPAADPVVAVVAAFHPSEDRDGLHVVIEDCQQGVEVPVVEGLKRPTGQLDVLLRRGLRSIPR
jgi:hypothetical protein